MRSLSRILAAFAPIVLLGCGRDAADQPSGARVLTLAAYTTPREPYNRAVLPGFARQWQAQHGEAVRFEESYLGSGAQSRAIAAGFRADIAALSLEPDIQSLVTAGLVDSAWKQGPTGGMVSRSLVVFAVREGNPKNIRRWEDLARPGVEVLTPNPATSGGAMWNIAALVGAALRGGTNVAAGDSAGAEQLLARVLGNVRIMDKGARESMLTFEQGVGDVAITYENEVIAARLAGQKIAYVIPPATIWIDNPIAVVNYAKAKGNDSLAAAFVRYVTGEEAQKAFAAYGYRPVIALTGIDSTLTAAVPGAFSIEELGGWPRVVQQVFAAGGMFARASQSARATRR